MRRHIIHIKGAEPDQKDQKTGLSVSTSDVLVER